MMPRSRDASLSPATRPGHAWAGRTWEGQDPQQDRRGFAKLVVEPNDDPGIDPMPGASEHDLIAWIRGQAATNSRTQVGIGDDCAALRFTAGRQVLVTTDLLAEGRHFRLAETTAEAVGRKAMGVNLSDIAAMAGIPVAAFVAVCLPAGSAAEVARGLMRGMMPLAERFGVSLAGGDTNSWGDGLVVTVTLLGEATGRGPVFRSGAKVGDLVGVTGRLGGSILGRHLSPMPRIDEALRLHEIAPIHSMIDLSDGLSSDLRHILRESGGLGALLEAGAIPIHADAEELARRDGLSALRHALDDGEDFELCLTAPAESFRLWRQALGDDFPLHQVGIIREEPGPAIRMEDGRIGPLARGGFDHFLRDGAFTSERPN
jgi:thiamine-monophosphate kinase